MNIMKQIIAWKIWGFDSMAARDLLLSGIYHSHMWVVGLLVPPRHADMGSGVVRHDS